MLVRFIALILSLALSISVVAGPAQAEVLPYFDPKLRLDPNFSTPRTVMLTQPSYLYACLELESINMLFFWDRSEEFQRYRSTYYGSIKCDYISTGVTERQYLVMSKLNNLVPLVNPATAPRTPLPPNVNRKYNEVLVPYLGAYSEGTPYYVLLSHQVIDGQVQTGVGYDFLSRRFGG